MKITLVLISLSWFYLINAVPLKRTRQPTTTTNAGFMAKLFRIPDFLKFSRNEPTTEPLIKTIELPQKSCFSRILDSVNIFKKSKLFGEPYLRAYVQPDGSHKWYFVYPGQLLYPAPDDFSIDFQKTIPPTTTTTTTERPRESDDEYKPLYPLGKIEFVKNESEPKENKGAITISDDGPIFQPYVKIKPPFDEPLFQQFQINGEDNQEPQEEPEPVEENESISRKHRKRTKTPKPEESAQNDEPAEDDQPDDEQVQDKNQAAYDNDESEENSSADKNAADDDDNDDEPQNEDEKTIEESPPAKERTSGNKVTPKKVKPSV